MLPYQIVYVCMHVYCYNAYKCCCLQKHYLYEPFHYMTMLTVCLQMHRELAKLPRHNIQRSHSGTWPIRTDVTDTSGVYMTQLMALTIIVSVMSISTQPIKTIFVIQTSVSVKRTLHVCNFRNCTKVLFCLYKKEHGPY